MQLTEEVRCMTLVMLAVSASYVAMSRQLHNAGTRFQLNE